MNESKFKTLRHIETVRNYLNASAIELLKRGEQHDQSKLMPPEVETFAIYTEKLRGCTYGSAEYRSYLKEMDIALNHHYKNNKHHPQFYENGIRDMSLFDLVEMLCDWYSSTLRHNDGDVYKSIEINQERDGYSDELKQIFINTMHELRGMKVSHYANES